MPSCHTSGQRPVLHHLQVPGHSPGSVWSAQVLVWTHRVIRVQKGDQGEPQQGRSSDLRKLLRCFSFSAIRTDLDVAAPDRGQSSSRCYELRKNGSAESVLYLRNNFQFSLQGFLYFEHSTWKKGIKLSCAGSNQFSCRSNRIHSAATKPNA